MMRHPHLLIARTGIKVLTVSRYLFIGSLVFLLSSCASTYIRDLQVVSVSVEEFDSIPSHMPGQKQPGRKVLKILLSTSKDIGSWLFEGESTVSTNFSSCKDREYEFARWSAVYYYDVPLQHYPKAAAAEYAALIQNKPANTPFYYTVYFFPKDGPTREYTAQPIRGAYDLSVRAEDVCLRLGGGMMWVPLRNIFSNNAVIPKEMISEALKGVTLK
jgi:hypothetical protein